MITGMPKFEEGGGIKNDSQVSCFNTAADGGVITEQRILQGNEE